LPFPANSTVSKLDHRLSWMDESVVLTESIYGSKYVSS
jgi:hypothetical protein